MPCACIEPDHAPAAMRRCAEEDPRRRYRAHLSAGDALERVHGASVHDRVPNAVLYCALREGARRTSLARQRAAHEMHIRSR